MPVRHIKVDRGESPQGYTSSGQKQVPDRARARRLSNRAGDRHVEAGFSEPRSGGPQERAMTSPGHERRHPNALQIERGNDFYAAGASEALNDEKFNDPNRRVVIVPPGPFEHLSVGPDGALTEASKTHGYDPASLRYAAAALAEAQNHDQ